MLLTIQRPWYNDLVECFRQALRVVEEEREKGKPVKKFRKRLTREGSTSSIWADEYDSYERIDRDALDAFESTPAAQALLVKLGADDFIISLFDGKMSNAAGQPLNPRDLDLERHIWRLVFMPLAFRYLDLTPLPRWDPSVFEETLDYWEKRHVTGGFPGRLRIPIWRLKLPNRRIELPPFVLRPMIDAELNELITANFIQPFSSFRAMIGAPDSVLEYDFIHEKPGTSGIPGEVSPLVSLLMQALKVFKEGCPWVEFAYTAPEKGEKLIAGAMSIYTPRPVFPVDPRYVVTLNEKEASGLESLWALITGQIGSRQALLGELGIAVKRLSLAVAESDPEERIIDLIIALESLLLGVDEKDELKYKLSLRGAMLLSDSESDAVRVRQRLGVAYNRRSEAVHGKPMGKTRLDGKEVTAGELAVIVERNVREVIQRSLVLAKTANLKARIKLLEQAILSDVERAALRHISSPSW